MLFSWQIAFYGAAFVFVKQLQETLKRRHLQCKQPAEIRHEDICLGTWEKIWEKETFLACFTEQHSRKGAKSIQCARVATEKCLSAAGNGEESLSKVRLRRRLQHYLDSFIPHFKVLLPALDAAKL